VGVQDLMLLTPTVVTAQIDSVLADIGCDAAKTGMLGTSSIVSAVARAVKRWRIARLVVDPVIVSTTGKQLLRPTGVRVLRDHLIPLASVVTPNMQEAEWLSERPVRTLAGMEAAARAIFDSTGTPVLVKGGHLTGRAVDLFYDGTRVTRFSAARIRTRQTHGSGCTLAAAIAAYLARDCSLADAIAAAKEYLQTALQNGYSIGRGPGPLGDGCRSDLEDESNS
jgi:hydroxymethylpyrimidine/phosphomethylpyrimidine kinase